MKLSRKLWSLEHLTKNKKETCYDRFGELKIVTGSSSGDYPQTGVVSIIAQFIIFVYYIKKLLNAQYFVVGVIQFENRRKKLFLTTNLIIYHF